jgi:hypothetical protein
MPVAFGVPRNGYYFTASVLPVPQMPMSAKEGGSQPEVSVLGA